MFYGRAVRRRQDPSPIPWDARLDLPPGWVEVPPGWKPKPMLRTRDPYLVGARKLVKSGELATRQIFAAQTYLETAAAGEFLAVAGHVTGSAPEDLVFQSFAIFVPTKAEWTSFEGMTEYVRIHPVGPDVVETPTPIEARLGPGLRTQRRSEFGMNFSYWIWLEAQSEVVICAGGYELGRSASRDGPYTSSLDRLATTLMLSRTDGAGGESLG